MNETIMFLAVPGGFSGDRFVIDSQGSFQHVRCYLSELMMGS